MTCRYGIFVRNTRTLQHFKRHLRYFCRDVIRRKIESDHSEFRENVVLRSIVQVAKPSTDQEGERERAEDEHQWPPQLQRLRTPAGDPTEKREKGPVVLVVVFLDLWRRQPRDIEERSE